MRACLTSLILGLLLLPAAFAQTTAISINTGGTFSFTYADNGDQTVTIGSANGPVTPFGQATLTGGYLILWSQGLKPPFTGSFTFTFGSAGSFTVGCSGTYTIGEDPIPCSANVAGGTGIFAQASGTVQLSAAGFAGDSSGAFILTGSGNLSGVVVTTSTPFPVPGSPQGPGPQGDPSLVNCTTCSQPVTVSNGNMYHQFNDLSLSSRGFPVTLSRTYNSQSGADGMFGIGWTNNYQRWLQPGSSTVVYYNESGGAYSFTAQGAGYTSPAGLDMTLTRTSTGGYQIQTAHGFLMLFDSTGRLTSLADQNGNAHNLSYNAQGRVAAVTDAGGDSLTFTYDGNNHVISVRDSAGRQEAYQYDSTGNLIASTDPTSAKTSYSYLASSAGGYLQTITFADGGTIQYQYGSDHRTSQVIDRGGAGDQFTYTPSSSQTVIKDELGNLTTFQYNSSGNVTHKVKPDSSTTSATWDANSRPLTITDENGAVTTFQNDAKGNLLSTTNALGGTVQFSYDPVFNKITSYKDANGNLTQAKYDAKGNLLNVADPLGGNTSFTYDSSGNPLSTTDANGNTSSFASDAHGNLLSVTDPLGNTTSMTYDAAGHPLTLTAPLHSATSLQYDALGRVTRTTNSLGQSSSFTYDPVGNLASQTDSNGHTSSFTYDHLGNLTQTTDAAGNATTFAYSPGACNGCSTAGTLSAIGNPLGQNTNFVYNSVGYLVKTTDPLQHFTQFSYDPAGNLTQEVDRNGATTSLAYDALHRLRKRTLPDGSTETFTYDANGNVLTAANANVTLTYTYDGLNQVTSVADSRFPAPTVYTYDHTGHRTSMTDPYGARTAYQYDADGRLVKLGSPNGQFTVFRYDAAGRRVAIAMGNGVAGDYRYDGANRLTALTYRGAAHAASRARLSAVPLLAEYVQSYDKSGNRVATGAPTGTRTWRYDALNQLVAATNPAGPAESYTYDAAGNRTASGSQTWKYDGGGRLVSAGSATYTYDSNGNTLTHVDSGGTTTYTYDGLNRLTGVALPNGAAVAYKYDPFGARIEKDVAGVATRYLNDGPNVLLEQSGSGTWSARYTYGPHIDEPLIMERGGAAYYYLVDSAGNIVGLTDSTGATVERYDYDSFGNLLSSAGTILNPYSFAGRAFDSETGLYYFRARYYNPATGRFLTQDPFSPANLLTAPAAAQSGPRTILASNMRSPLRLNAYAYAANNPVNLKDPFGLALGNIFGDELGAVGGITSGNPSQATQDLTNQIEALFNPSGTGNSTQDAINSFMSAPSATCTNPGPTGMAPSSAFLAYEDQLEQQLLMQQELLKESDQSAIQGDSYNTTKTVINDMSKA